MPNTPEDLPTQRLHKRQLWLAAWLWTSAVVTASLIQFLTIDTEGVTFFHQGIVLDIEWVHLGLDFLMWLVGLLCIVAVMRKLHKNGSYLHRMQQELQLTQAAIEQMHDSLFLIGDGGRIRHVNETAVRNLGYTRQELLRMTVMDINPDADMVILDAHWKTMPQTGSRTFETRHRRKDGEIFPVEVTSSRFSHEGREYLLSIARDISQRKKTEVLLDRRLQHVTGLSAFSRALLDHSADAISRALAHLLEAAATSRAYLLEARVEADDGAQIVSIHEQCGPEVEPRFGGGDITHDLPRISPPQRWLQSLQQNEPVGGLVEDLPQSEQARLTAYGVQSILLMPVWIGNRWGGYIGLEDTRARRRWQDGEIELLRAAAEMLGIYLTHQGTETILRDSEQRLSEAQRIAHIGSWEWRLRDGLIIWSDETYRIFGKDPDRFAPTFDAFMECVHPDDRDKVKAAVDAASQDGAAYSIDYRIRQSDGTVRQVHARGEVVVDDSNEPVGMNGTVRDVSRQKETEQQLHRLLEQNQRLHHRCLLVQEDERRLLAHELHDEMGQLLSAIKMDAAYIEKKWGQESAELASVAADIQDIVLQGMQGIRVITQHLRPPILDQFGLLDAIQELVDEWQRRNRDTEVSLSMVDELPELSDMQKISIYRCVQEGLTNISRHARASHVSLCLQYGDERLELVLEDDGWGMDTALPHDGLGLYGLKERAEAVGGSICYRSEKGQGFRLSMVLPLSP